MKITFLDGNFKEYPQAVSIEEIAFSISPSLKKEAVGAFVNDELYDLNRMVESDAVVKIITKKDKEALDVLNHSAAHLLAQAVKRIYPDACFGVGPAIENGFYYDIDTASIITESDLKIIEKEMQKITQENFVMTRNKLSKQEALKFFKDDKYKVEIISDLDVEFVSTYTQGEFTDLCLGGHIGYTKNIKFFKLLSLAGAYWRGDSNNKQLTRIYGTAFFSKEDLNNYLIFLEEAKKRDHRKLGKELGLFMISEYGPGFPFFLPNGVVLRQELESFWYKIHKRENYQFIQTPIMLNKDLWEVSGHWFNYRENMYVSEIDKHEFAIKPMNCPGAMLVYQNQIHSYKEFPLRVGELGLVHRHEASGALHGLFRVRNFTQDDAHIFMSEDQIVSEVVNLINLFKEIYHTFGLEHHIELSTRPEKAIGSQEIWEISEKALAEACTEAGYDYVINEGDGAFYGPKLDFKLKDSLNRIWQCGTIQLDMNLPERFDLNYIASDGLKKRPIMLHRAIFGSLERFLGILIEHYAGAFPLWLAPRQIMVIPVNNEFHLDYANEINNVLNELDLRSEIDAREEKLGYKIREAQTLKIPYQIVIGDSEVENKNVTIRKYGSKDQITYSVDEFINILKNEIKEKL